MTEQDEPHAGKRGALCVLCAETERALFLRESRGRDWRDCLRYALLPQRPAGPVYTSYKTDKPRIASPPSFALMSNFAARRATSVNGSATTLMPPCKTVKIIWWSRTQAGRAGSQAKLPSCTVNHMHLMATHCFSVQRSRKMTSREHTVATTFTFHMQAKKRGTSGRRTSKE